MKCGESSEVRGVISQPPYHYENTPIQIYCKFHPQKLKIFRWKTSDIFHISAQNIDCGYSLEPPRWGGSNEYPQSMFSSRNKKNNVYPFKPQFHLYKWGLRGTKLYRCVFVMFINRWCVLNCCMSGKQCRPWSDAAFSLLRPVCLYIQSGLLR